MTAREAVISIYENEVPAFTGAEMDRLYGNIFSSLTQFRIYGWKGGDTSTYVVRRNGAPTAVLLFRREGQHIQVMNEVITLDGDELTRFANYLFGRYAGVNVISFKAIETPLRHMPFPHQRFNHLEDLALTLPHSQEDYFASLGKSTRRNIRRHTDRINRVFPSYRFSVFEKDAIAPQRIREIIELNRARMADKNIVSIIDEHETQRIIQLVQACGLVGVITIDGCLCAGAVSFQSGSNYFLNVLAHDPRYDDYWLGFLCCYQLIRECIARGGNEFHFLWGRYDYKFLLGARQRDLDNIVLYRSRMQFLRNIGIARKVAAEGYMRALKVWLKYGDTFLSQRARWLMERVRAWRRAADDRGGEGGAVFLKPSREK